MAKQNTEDELHRINAIRDTNNETELREALKRGLGNRSGLIVGKAAEVIAERMITGLDVELVRAYQRLSKNSLKSDRGCRGKAGVVDALYHLGAMEIDLYLDAVRLKQLEPVWGGHEDTAVCVRSVAALALVRANYHDVMNELAGLLADEQHTARIGAAKAIGYRGLADGEPLLRLKVLSGDSDQEVLAECMTSILAIAGEAGLDFVKHQLEKNDHPRWRAAAVALGQSRDERAFDVLHENFERTLDRQSRADLLTAMAMLRQETATHFMVGLMRHGNNVTAQETIQALSMYHYDGKLKDRLLDAAEDSELAALINDVFD